MELPDPGNPQATPGRVPSGDFLPFAAVLREELKLIGQRRRFADGVAGPEADLTEPAGVDVDKQMMELRVAALKEHTTGLSFSGGGIRSGTFAVGFLQGLGTLGLLGRFDFLSTVSGGGYAGGWVAAWLKRQGDVKNVELQLNPNRVAQSRADRPFLSRLDERGDRVGQVVDEEPEPIRHLRAYSSYMVPRPGLLTADTWTILTIWGRNVIINLMMLLPMAMLLVLAGRVVVYLYGLMNQAVIGGTRLDWVLAPLILVAGILCLAFGFYNNGTALREFRRKDPRLRPSRIEARIYSRVVHPLLAAAVLLTIAARWILWKLGDVLDRPAIPAASHRPSTLVSQLGDLLRSHLGLLQFPNFALHFLIFGVLFAVGALRIGLRDGSLKGRFLYSAFLAGGTGGLLFVLLEGLIARFAVLDRPDLMATFGPPLALLVVVGSLVVEVALLGRDVEESEREWWARFGALNTIAALLWTAGLATILYVPGLILASGAGFRTLIATGWLGSAAFGVIAGKFVLPRLGGKGFGLTAIASVAAQLFLVGLIGLVSLAVAVIVNVPSIPSVSGAGLGPFAHYLEGIKGASIWILVVLAIASWVAFELARGLIDVNLFSLNAMYANRLIRCYLGASRARDAWKPRWGSWPRDTRLHVGTPATAGGVGTSTPRDANPVTGFDPRDDFDLIDLRIGKSEPGVDRPYWGPHLLINTTLNLVGGQDLAWRDRKGESFLLSPLYCGSRGTGYALMDETSRTKLTLGRALSISGAAVDPNMSFFQSAPLTALLTVFNARLGYWLEKPKQAGWKADSPKFGDLLLSEFFGQTDQAGDFVHISDGGHFENLGVYELIRRRCRYIVAVDAAEDGQASNDNLSIMIRLCRIDFGVRIKVDTRPLTMTGPDNLTRAHVVIGRIHYDDVDQGEMPGVLVYVRISLTGDEPPDIQKYARKEPAFPHQPTDLRQSFDEEQFESYRCLGDHIAREVFADAARRHRAIRSRPHRDYVPALFSAVQARWGESPRLDDDRLIALGRQWSDLHRDFRRSPDLAGLSRELYPDLPPSTAPPPSTPDRERAEVHAVNQMLQHLAGAWVALDLKEHPDLPGARGWLNTFRRWTSTPTFRRYWPLVRSEFDPEFVRFCEAELHLNAATPATVPLTGVPPFPAGASFESDAVQQLSEEFAREWPAEARVGRGLADLLRGADELRNEAGLAFLPAWLIVQSSSGSAPDGLPESRSVAGIMLAREGEIPPGRSAPPGRLPPVEFFAWVRPPYRSAGLGSVTVRDVLDGHLIAALREVNGGTNPELWARYPKVSEGGDSDLEGATWLNFFARSDFRRYVPPGTAGLPCTLLVRDSGPI